MKRPSTKTAKPALPRLSRDAERLVMLARSLAVSSSRVEDEYWENLLEADLARLLEHGSDSVLDHALDAVFTSLPAGYDVLMEAAETHAESLTLEHQGTAWQALLVTAPILASSKYAIPSGPLNAELAQTLQTHLQAHVAATDTRVALLPMLYSIDQLPRKFSETRALTQNLAQHALQATPYAKPRKLPETAALLADTRYLLAVILAPLKPSSGAALFRWQEAAMAVPSGPAKSKTNARELALKQWQAQAHPNLIETMAGCVFELSLPNAFHAACRDSDRAIRPYSLKAALAFLESALNVEAKQFRAVLGAFGNERPEEFRVGFTLRNHPDVVHGAVWPLYGMEESLAPNEVQEQIEKLLNDCGIETLLSHEQGFPMEFCDDCGAPLFADPSGDLVHAELPEETEMPSVHHLH